MTANKDSLSLERLRECALLIIMAPREKFSQSELDALKSFVAEGGSLLIALGEGGEAAFGTNIGVLTEQFGVEINSDAVVRTVYHKYTHPKEVFIQGGVLQPSIDRAAGRGGSSSGGRAGGSGSAGGDSLAFAFAYGASLNVSKPAFPVLSSGHLSIPLNRPVCALAEGRPGAKGAPPGRVCVLGAHLVLVRTRAKLAP